MKFDLSKRMAKNLTKRIQRHEFEVGVFTNAQYRLPKAHGLFEEPETRSYAGGPVRKIGKGYGDKTIDEIFIENQKRLRIDLLREPFKSKSKELVTFANRFLKFTFGRVKERQIINLAQAIVRNPILRKDYGNNSKATAEYKGFDRHLFDTGQMFKNILARLKSRPE